MFVSVLMITYNHSRFLKRAIDSVLEQETSFSWELIIGDDFSSDGSNKILSEYGKLHPDKLRILSSNTRLGMNANFARTLAASRGKYVAILDGDDFWYSKTKLEKQVRFLETHEEYAICAGECVFVHTLPNGSEELTFPSSLFPQRDFASRDVLFRNPIASCTAVLRREVFNFLPQEFIDLGLGDWPAWYFACRGGKIHVLPELLGAYRRHAGNSWSGRDPRFRYAQHLKMFKLLKRHILDGEEKALRRGQHYSVGSCAYALVKRREVLLSLSFILKCVFFPRFEIDLVARLWPIMAFLPNTLEASVRKRAYKFKSLITN